MLTMFSGQPRSYCDGVSRRDFLRIGSLGLGGLTLPGLLALQAQGAATDPKRAKSVIMISLGGGPSHLDMYDMKPDAPSAYCGEFRPIKTNVPGFDICELFPRQAKLADKFAVVRSMQWVEPDHQRAEIFTGFPKKDRRPSFGSIVSKLAAKEEGNKLPRFVSLTSDGDKDNQIYEAPGYVGDAHRPFIPSKRGGDNFTLQKEITLERFEDRKKLLSQLDTLRRNVDAHGPEFEGIDAFTAQALDMMTSPYVRAAFDISDEPANLVARYGTKGSTFHYGAQTVFNFEALIQARRLAEAGVPYISLQLGEWDHHGGGEQGTIFGSYRTLLPLYDQAIAALIEDLHDRGLDKDVAVVIWGEFGRGPRINGVGGREHWPASGFAMFAGGGWKTGQTIGATDKTGSTPISRPYNSQNVLATLYRVLGIDPATTLPDISGRPMYLLEDREPISELI